MLLVVLLQLLIFVVYWVWFLDFRFLTISSLLLEVIFPLNPMEFTATVSFSQAAFSLLLVTPAFNVPNKIVGFASTSLTTDKCRYSLCVHKKTSPVTVKEWAFLYMWMTCPWWLTWLIPVNQWIHTHLQHPFIIQAPLIQTLAQFTRPAKPELHSWSVIRIPPQSQKTSRNPYTTAFSYCHLAKHYTVRMVRKNIYKKIPHPLCNNHPEQMNTCCF